MAQEIKKGDRMRVVAPGEFQEYIGTVVQITQKTRAGRPYIWLEFDNHPWQKPGVKWSFIRQELRRS